jgi:hypothetical protein
MFLRVLSECSVKLTDIQKESSLFEKKKQKYKVVSEPN